MSINNDKGSALVIVMALILVLIILGTAVLGVTAGEYRMERAYRNSVKAYYIAEAGMEKAIYEIASLSSIHADGLMALTWIMDNEDRDLLGCGVSGSFSVTVESAILSGILYVDETETDVSEYLYEVVLRSVGMVEGVSRAIEAKVEVQHCISAAEDNKVHVLYWRQAN